jgi:hypothetical protein
VSIGYRNKIKLAHLRMMSQLPVRTHVRPEPVRKRPLSNAQKVEAGKLARKTFA